MIEACSEQLITINELRARMPHLRARETSLRGQIDALDAQLADRDAYLKLAADLEGFLAQLRGSAATATVEERQRVLRLLVKDILICPGKITIRHRIPTRTDGSGTRQRDPDPIRRVTIARIIYCVAGVITAPCRVPVTGRRTCPSSITPARSITRRRFRTGWSHTRSSTARINLSNGIASKQLTIGLGPASRRKCTR